MRAAVGLFVQIVQNSGDGLDLAAEVGLLTGAGQDRADQEVGQLQQLGVVGGGLGGQLLLAVQLVDGAGGAGLDLAAQAQDLAATCLRTSSRNRKL